MLLSINFFPLWWLFFFFLLHWVAQGLSVGVAYVREFYFNIVKVCVIKRGPLELEK